MGGQKVEHLAPKSNYNGLSDDDNLNPNYKHIWFNNEEKNKLQKNISNYIKTTKYSAVSFLPMSLLY
jgi:hypothetical protein